MPPDNVDAFVRLKAETAIPICQSERVFTRFGFRPWIEKAACDIVMPDLSWGGGLTEGRKIAAMADTAYLPLTCHDTIGPVALWAATHLMLTPRTALIMETVRGYVDGWYNDVVTDRIPIADGKLGLPDRPGLGTRLRDDFSARPNARVEITTEENLKRLVSRSGTLSPTSASATPATISTRRGAVGVGDIALDLYDGVPFVDVGFLRDQSPDARRRRLLGPALFAGDHARPCRRRRGIVIFRPWVKAARLRRGRRPASSSSAGPAPASTRSTSPPAPPTTSRSSTRPTR